MHVVMWKAEEAARQQLELDEDMAANAMKKSPSDLSCASIDLYIPKRPHPGTGNNLDKECLSMKSDCGIDTRRKLSIINAVGKKVSNCKTHQTIPFIRCAPNS